MDVTDTSSASKTRYEWNFSQHVDPLEMADVRDSVGNWSKSSGDFTKKDR